MNSDSQAAATSSGTLWASRILTGLPALFLLVDGVMKLFKPSFVIEATVKLGIPDHLIVPLGVVLTLCTILYLIPRTTVLGAILLTGYLGGAVNTHVRAYAGWFPILFPVIVGAMLWGGIYLRDKLLPLLIPITAPGAASPNKMRYAGYVLSILPSLLLFFSAFAKLSKNPQATGGFKSMGYPDSAILIIGAVEAICTVLYLIPRTSVIGAILLTGYMGGAVVTHLRVGEPFFVQVLVGVLLWGGLWFRDERVRALIPLRK